MVDLIHFICVMRFHILAFIHINTYQGEYIEEGTIVFIHSLNIQQFALVNVLFGVCGESAIFLKTHTVAP